LYGGRGLTNQICYQFEEATNLQNIFGLQNKFSPNLTFFSSLPNYIAFGRLIDPPKFLPLKAQLKSPHGLVDTTQIQPKQ